MPCPCDHIGPLPHLPPHEINVPVQAKSGVPVHFTLNFAQNTKQEKRQTASNEDHGVSTAPCESCETQTPPNPQVPSGVRVYSNLGPSCSAPDKYSGKDSFAQDERSFSWTRISHVVTSAFERILQACHSMAMPNTTPLIVLYVSEVVGLGWFGAVLLLPDFLPVSYLEGDLRAMQYWTLFCGARVSCCCFYDC